MTIAILELTSPAFRATVFGRAALAGGGPPLWTLVLPHERVAHDGRIDGLGFARGLRAVEDLLERVASAAPGGVVAAVASGAVASASNAATFCDEVRLRFGLEVERLSARAHARLVFAGVRRAWPDAGTCAVVDLADDVLTLTAGDDEAAVVEPISLAECAELRGAALFARPARELLAARVRFAIAGAARAVWGADPARAYLTSCSALALGSIGDELGLRAPLDPQLDTAALGRIADVLAQFAPREPASSGRLASGSGCGARDAIVLRTTLDALGFASASIARPALAETLAARAVAADRSTSDDDEIEDAVIARPGAPLRCWSGHV